MFLLLDCLFTFCLLCLDTRSSNSSFGTVSRPFVTMVSPAQPQSELAQTQNFEDERTLLRQKRTEVLNISADTPSKPITLLTRASSMDKSPSSESCNTAECIVEPDPSRTTRVNQVMRLAAVYSACLDANLVPNIISELYLIFTLLTISYKSKISDIPMSGSESARKTSSEESESSCDAKCVLSSVHNCVMFAATVIDKQHELVQCLDKAVIRLLIDNTRLSLFVPHVIPHLVHIAESKVTPFTFYFSSINEQNK